MKKSLFLIAAAAAAIFSCAKQEPEKIDNETAPEVPAAYEYIFSAAGDTKAAFADDHIAWTDGDKVGWFAGASLTEGNSAIDMSTTPRSFKVGLSSPLAAGDKLYVYAPFASAGKTASALALSIPAEQSSAAAMPMVAAVTLADDIAANTEASAGEVRFVNLGSTVLFKVFTTNDAYAGETVTGVRFEASGAIAGDCTIDLTKVDPANAATLALSGLTGTSVTAAASAAPGSEASPLKVNMVVAPGTFSGTVTILTDKASYAYTVLEQAFVRNALKPLKVDLATGVRTANTPALDCPYWHNFANGDWGIGPVFDWGGWEDGYYYNMLTTPDVLDGASWNISAAEYFQWNGTQAETGNWRHGIQLCTGGLMLSNFKISSSSFPGEITKVTLGYNSGIVDNSSLTVSCKVGGAAFGSQVAHGDGDYEAIFTGSASGEIEITLNSTVNGAVYLYYIAVEYDPAGSVTPPDPGNETVWDHTFSAGDFGIAMDATTEASSVNGTISGKAWTLSNDVSAYKFFGSWGWAGTVIWNGNGWSALPLSATLSSSAFDGTISKVVVDLSLGGGQILNVSCTVGGVALSATQQINNNDEEHPQQSVTFSGSGSGEIVITVTQSVASTPIMMRGVHVTYTPN